MPYDCFISYASADIRLAEELHERLLAEGLKVWFDRVRLHAGYDWHREIEDGCENSRVFLPVLTPRWKQSEWTKFETYGAEAVIPLVYEGSWEDVCTSPLERFQAERLDHAHLSAVGWDSLFAALHRALGQPGPLKQRHIAHLPSLANPFFTGRERDLVALHEELHTRPRACLSQGRVRAITANGGYGKTTLVRHYAEKYWRCYPQMFWVDARLGFEAEFARLHDLLFPSESAAGYRDNDKALRALHALEGRETRFLVIDNAIDEQSALRWVPKSGGCYTLITTCFAGWSPAIKTFHLQVLESEPSVQFLQQRVGRISEGPELRACEVLAQRLGYLPLAMEQAAAYVEQQGEDFRFADYVRLYDKAAANLLATRPPGDYPDSVMTTWSSSMDRIGSAARALLRISAFMASAPLSVDVLIAAANRVRNRAGETTMAPEGVENELYIRSGLAELKCYSLAQFNGQTIQVHCLLQLVVRLSLPLSERSDWWKTAVAIIVAAGRGHGFALQLRTQWKELLPHAESLQQAHAELPGTDPSTELAEILRDCYYSQGRYEQAHPFAELVYQEDKREFGADDIIYTVQSLNQLAEVQRRRSAFAEAEQAWRMAHDTACRLLGSDHPLSLAFTQNLALVLEKQGRLDEAELFYQTVLQRRPHDMTVLGNYAYMLQNCRRNLSRARELYLCALDIDPNDTINLNNYAGLCLVMGDLPEAEARLNACWRVSSRRLDRMAARTLFFRTALAALRQEPTALFIGQVKTITKAGFSPAPSENALVMEHLQQHLPAAIFSLLDALYAAINEPDGVRKLAARPDWQVIAPIPLERPWPKSMGD